MSLLTIQNSKTIKGEDMGYLTGILYLMPNGIICPNATKGCMKACLVSAGRGVFKNVRDARIRKTKMFLKERDKFMNQLVNDIEKLTIKALNKGLTPVVRLNGTSDIDWGKIKLDNGNNIFEEFEGLQFYDYTKDYFKAVQNKMPNYHLTYSRSELTQISTMRTLINKGVNVAIVYKDDTKLSNYKAFMGMPIISGDEHDLRFLDPQGAVIALKAKGKAKLDQSGFVV